MDNIAGIPIAKKIKYLVYQFSPVKKQILEDAWANIKKHLNFIQQKLRARNLEVQAILFSAYGRSVIFYFVTPLVTCNVWDLDDVSSLGNKNRHKVLGLGNFISGDQINTLICHWHAKPLVNVIVEAIEN